jgi:LPS export ABC transporter protein LptC
LALRPNTAPGGADLRNAFLMLVLGAAAIASWIYSRQEPVAPPPRSNRDDTPLGYYLNDTQMLITDAQGHVAYRILADRLEERTDPDRLQLDGVQIEFRPADSVAWVMRAATGSAPKDSSKFDLGGGVELRSEPSDGSAPVRLSAESLTLDPASSSATSDQLTELHTGDWHLAGTGFRALLKEQRVALESDVHGKFAR